MRRAFENKFVFTMVMSPCDSIFSVEENFEDTEQALHPSLLLQATSIPTNGRKRKSIDPSVVTTADRESSTGESLAREGLYPSRAGICLS